MKPIIRPRNLIAAAFVLALATAGGVFAWWHANGAGTASASLATLGSPAPVSAGNDTGVAHVSWTKVSSPSGDNSDVTYLVERSTDGTHWGAVGSGTGDTCSGSLQQGTGACDDRPATTGDYYYRVTARFKSSWTSRAQSGSVHVVTDTTAPTTTDDAPSVWKNASVTVKLTATDSGTGGGDPSGIASITYSIDSGTPTTVTVSGAPVSSSTNVLIAAPSDHSNDGTHTITYYASDVAGNSETFHTAAVKIDTQRPSTQATGTDGNWHNTAVTIHLAASDQAGLSGVANIKYQIDSKPLQTIDGASGDVLVSAPSDHSDDGSHTVSYFATDNAGNLETAGLVTIKIDTAAPTGTSLTTTPTANANGWINSTPVTVTLSGTTDTGGSGVALVKYTTDGSNPTSSGTAQTYNSGSKPQVSVTTTFKYAAQDAAGNWETVHTSIVQIDTTAPSVTLSHTADGLNGWNKTAPVAVSVAVSDAGSGIAAKPVCTVDGSAATVSGTSSPYIVSVSANGTHPVSCSVSDNAGNSNSGNDQVSLDTVAPSNTSLSTSPSANGNGWINTTPVTVTLSGTTDTGGSGVALVKYTTDGSDPTTSGTSQTYNSGSKPQVSVTTTFKYAAQDVAGNWETVHTTAVQIDTVAPNGGTFTVAGATSTAGGATSTLNNSTTFSISNRTDYSDSGSGIASSLLTVQSESLTSGGCGALGSGGPFTTAQTITGTTQPTGIVAGACYVYVLTGADKAGNTASVRVTVIDNSVSFQVTAQPTTVTAGQATTGNAVSIRAIKNGATDTGYTGSTLTWSGANQSPSGATPTLPTNPTWSSGIANFDITLVKAETETLSVNDGTRSTGNFSPITVGASTATKLAWTNISTNSPAGIPNPCFFVCTYSSGFGNNSTWNANVSITDAFGNTVSSVGSGHNVTVTLGGTGNGSITGGSPATLTMPSAGPAQSSTQVQFRGGNGSSWSNTMTATSSGFSSAAASFSK